MKDISLEWLRSAKSDIETIDAILEKEQLTHIVAFHAQQCVEKCLKAVIEEFELHAGKIHNLITLKEIVSKVKEFNFSEDILSVLNTLYIDSRYPGAFGLLPDGNPTCEDAKKFYEFAYKVYLDVKRFLSVGS